MSRLLSIGLALSLVPFATPTSTNSSEVDERAIRAQLDGWASAWNDADAEAIAAFYADDADRTFAHGVVVSGKTAIRDLYERSLGASLPDGIEQSISIRILSVRLITEVVAVADYEYEATGIPIAPDLVVNGRSTVVMVKQDGSWLRTAQRNWIPTTPDCMRLCQASIADYPPRGH